MTTDSGEGYGSRRNLHVRIDTDTYTQLERLRDLLGMAPTQSQVVRYAIRELYYRETSTLTDTK